MGDTTPGERDRAPGPTGRATPDPPYVPGQRPRNAWVAPGSSDVVQDPAGQESAGAGEPTRSRRLLARIPGLSRLAEQSGWIGDGAARPSATDPGWVFHDEDEPGAFQGWLYHYADGTMVDADGTQYAFPDDATTTKPGADLAPEREPEPERDAQPEQAEQGEQGEQPEPEPEPEPEQDPEPEREPEPTSDKADPGTEAEPQAAEVPQPPSSGPPAVKAQSGSRADFPRFVEYSPSSVRGYVVGAVFLVSAVAGVLTLFVALSEDSRPAMVIAAGCTLLAVVSWWALLSWKPTVVSIHDGVLDITRAGHSERFELEDPSTVVEFTGRPGSPTWTAIVRHANGPRTVLRSSHVKPRQFERIVRYHRARQKPDSRATTEG